MINTLQQFRYIANLSVCGGEPTLAIQEIEQLFSHVIDNNIRVEGVTTTINGTIYSEDLLRLLAEMDEYMRKSKPVVFEPITRFTISRDKYHSIYMQQIGLADGYIDNVNKYSESKYFGGFSQVGKPIREGNAEQLPWLETRKITIPKPIIYYPKPGGEENNEFVWIGPYIAIDPDGNVTEIDASIINQQTKYNYGNVSTEEIYKIMSGRPKVRVLKKPKHNLDHFFNMCDRAMR